MNVREAITVMMVLLAWAPLAGAQAKAPLKLEQTIPLPDVQGRIDHLSLDAAGQRLFVSALDNNTVEVLDLKAGKRAHTISGLTSVEIMEILQGLNEKGLTIILVTHEHDARRLS